MSRCVPHIFNVICSYAFLGGSGTWYTPRFLAKKYRLELKHPGDGEEHGRVVGHKGRAGEDLVTTGSIEIKETPAYRIPAPLP